LVSNPNFVKNNLYKYTFNQTAEFLANPAGKSCMEFAALLRKASGCLADLAREACDGVRIDPARGEASRAVLKI
jgi:hypothetical protein